MAGEPMTAGEGSDGEVDRSGFVDVKSWVVRGEGAVSSGIRVFGGPIR